MLATERKAKIIELLNKTGNLKINELSRILRVSPVTARKDLEKLEREGLLNRTHGGATVLELACWDRSIFEKEKLHAEEKRRIAMAAAEMIHEGESILLDSGTTTTQIARAIKNKRNITVVTTALNIATELAGRPGIRLILPGGVVREKSLSLIGPLAEETLQKLFVDKAFVAVDGFNISHGLTTPTIEDARLDTIMIKRAQEVIVVTDSSKFGKVSFGFICEITAIHKVITDQGIRHEDRDTLEQNGVEVIIV